MAIELGVLFAVAALVCWGFGDFMLQRTTRKIGDWETLFAVTVIGTLMLVPFVATDIHTITNDAFLILMATSAILLTAAILDFEALKKGKLAVVEPVYALEVPITALLAFVVISEGLAALEIFLVVLLITGLVLVSLRSHHSALKRWIEKGVIMGIIASLFMGAANFLVGFASRITNPLLTNWFVNVFLAGIALFYILSHHRGKRLISDIAANKKLIVAVGVVDNLAWISFAIAATVIPIAIAIAISESYIALAALLGVLINKEVLANHQKLGLVTALGSAVALAALVA